MVQCELSRSLQKEQFIDQMNKKTNQQEKSRRYACATLRLLPGSCSYDSSNTVGEFPDFNSLEQRILPVCSHGLSRLLCLHSN